MSQRTAIEANPKEGGDPDASSSLGLRLILVGFAMMALAGGLMWWRFGPSMFMSLVTAAANCF